MNASGSAISTAARSAVRCACPVGSVRWDGGVEIEPEPARGVHERRGVESALDAGAREAGRDEGRDGRSPVETGPEAGRDGTGAGGGGAAVRSAAGAGDAAGAAGDPAWSIGRVDSSPGFGLERRLSNF